MRPDGQGGISPHGFYDDDLVRTGGGWRIARRQFTMAYFATVGPPVQAQAGDS